jgi:hypothetical protein
MWPWPAAPADESYPDRFELVEETRPRRADSQGVLRSLRVHSQFEGAERIADKWSISRDDTDRLASSRNNA